jgi:GTPase Era involved in 16S rRNA processing
MTRTPLQTYTKNTQNYIILSVISEGLFNILHLELETKINNEINIETFSKDQSKIAHEIYFEKADKLKWR